MAGLTRFAKSMCMTPPYAQAIWSMMPQGLPKKARSACRAIWARCNGVRRLLA